MSERAKIDAFVQRWAASSAAERANKDQFFLELCAILGVEAPDPNRDRHPDYCFEKPVVITHADGNTTTGFIDFYKRGCFVIEAKQGSEAGDAAIGTARRGTAGWDKAMRAAYGQALAYASYLPEGKPPFLITCDIGHVFEVWTGFSGAYGGYGARTTIELAKLADPEVFAYFRKVFTDPLSLDPARRAQKVTREVAGHLAGLARSLEAAGHDPERVAQFLMRCLFTMFAEDVGLLPERLFSKSVEERWMPEPRRFQAEVEALWKAMNDGLPFGYDKLLRFNGGLFAFTHSLPMTKDQLALLLEAAKCDWSSVEPAIFGTLVERALDPSERSRLGAHFTPREYIERLVRPAVIEPIRAEWELAQAQARQIVDKGDAEPTAEDRRKAAKVVRDFHTRLCHTRVLDPACGSGNFLYVTLDLFKRIEAEALRELADLGETQAKLGMEGQTVTPGQFLGIEVNPRAREIADLVLWIGYLQWWRRTYGRTEQPPEPVLREYRNIECRDAVLAYDDVRPRLDDHGKPVTVWDMRTYKSSPVTGKDVPDEDARVPVLDYVNARPAEWPAADYVVSNPPFVGDKMMRFTLGDGYVEALRHTYQDMGNCDLVMYWWDKTAGLVRDGKLKRFGLITTNSITQTFNRKVIERHLDAQSDPLALAWAIPDHPWVDAGADVRIAMTVGARGDTLAGKAVLGRVTFEEKEQYKEPQARRVEVEYRKVDRIHANLAAGADVTSAVSLRSNEGLSSFGMMLAGRGFVLTEDEYQALLCGGRNAPVLKRLVNARDIVQTDRGLYVIDFFGLSVREARDRFPEPYQRVLDQVKPERDNNRRKALKEHWWLFGEKRPGLRKALHGLHRYIAVPETSKHMPFVFVDTGILIEHGVIGIALEDAFFFGVLSGRIYHVWLFATVSWMGVGNDPRFRNNTCFDPFPFPDATDAQKARIRAFGERLNAHRKKVQAEHPDVTLTGMYNALERLREIDAGGPALTEKERAFHDRALIGVLKAIHDDLDAAVADAYGWPAALSDEEILERLVALNRERAEEEKRGIIRWLRPEFQNPSGVTKPVQPQLDGVAVQEKAEAPTGPIPWPKTVPEQLKAIRDLLPTRAGTWTAEEVAAAFRGKPKATVRRHLESLEALGYLVAYDDAGGRRWSVRAG